MSELAKIQKTKRSDKVGSFLDSTKSFGKNIKAWHICVPLMILNTYLILIMSSMNPAGFLGYFDKELYLVSSELVMKDFVHAIKTMIVGWLLLSYIVLLAISIDKKYRFLFVYPAYIVVWIVIGALVYVGRGIFVPWPQALAEVVQVTPIAMNVIGTIIVFFLWVATSDCGDDEECYYF